LQIEGMLHDAFTPYLKKLRQTALSEHTGRAALEGLLEHFTAQPKPVQKWGDYHVSTTI
jgi:hypothetical protein